MLTAVVMMVMMMVMMIMMIIIIPEDDERLNTSNMEVPHRISSFLVPSSYSPHNPLPLYEYIYHNIILPFFTGPPDNVFPKDFHHRNSVGIPQASIINKTIRP
jgi:hypothetical protein